MVADSVAIEFHAGGRIVYTNGFDIFQVNRGTRSDVARQQQAAGLTAI